MPDSADVQVRRHVPGALLREGICGGKTKYRVENPGSPRKERAMSSWKDTQELAWQDALAKLMGGNLNA